MLYQFFTQILNMSITVSFVITVILFIRSVMQKLPKKYLYLLWAIVGIRLLCPIAIPSSFSLFNIVETNYIVPMKSVPQKELSDKADFNQSAENISQSNSISAPSQEEHGVQNDNIIPPSGNTTSPAIIQIRKLNPVIQYGTIIWLAGITVIFLKNVYATLRIKRCLKKAVRYQKNIYECDNIPSPFVIGIIHPKIYIPFRLEERERKYIIRHEQYHIKRKDYIIKFTGFMLTCLYWFHPLVWLAYFLMIQDMEMSCDEYVLQNTADDIRITYSKSLLGFAMNQRGMAVGMLAFGKTDTRKRVKNILNFKKYKKGVGIIAVFLVVLAGAICLTNAKDTNKKPETEMDDKNTNKDSTGEASNDRNNDKKTKQNIEPEKNLLSFSDNDIQDAKKTVRQYFKKNFQDCDLKKLWYDEAWCKRNIAVFIENYGTNDIIILYSNFYVSKKCKDNSMNKDYTYRNFMWVLSKGKGSKWKVRTYGY